MSAPFDIWTVYGNRQDTDAAVVRELDRRLSEAEANNHANQRRVQAIHEALKELGLYPVEQSHGGACTIRFGGPGDWKAPGLTKELVDTIRPVKLDAD